MSKRRSRPFTTAAVILVLGFLIGFFFYMWNYDYKAARPKEFTLKRDLRMVLRIDQKGESGYGGPVAIVTVANASQNRVRVLDTIVLQPLYNLKLVYKSGGGEPKEIAMRADVAQRLAREEAEFSKDSYAISELLPGRDFSPKIPLNHYFDLKEKGKYELTVKYNPEKVAEAMGQTFEYLDVTSEAMSVTVQFNYPEAPTAENSPASNTVK